MASQHGFERQPVEFGERPCALQARHMNAALVPAQVGVVPTLAQLFAGFVQGQICGFPRSAEGAYLGQRNGSHRDLPGV